MKNIKRKEEGVSPVIATILMVAITVVLAATLYMMLPSGNETDTTEAMSGRVTEVDDGYIIEIDSGSVNWANDKPRVYNTDTGVSTTGSSWNEGTDRRFGNFSIGGSDVPVIFNDNDGNDNINGGDTFKLTTSTNMDNYQFRIKDTSLQVNLG